MKKLGRRVADRWMKKHKKSEIKYDIRLFDNRMFSLSFTMQAPSDIITKLAKWMAKKREDAQAMTMKEFAVDQRLYPQLLNGFRKAITEVEKKTKKDIPGFGIVTLQIEDTTYKETGDNTYDVHVKMMGDYTISESLE